MSEQYIKTPRGQIFTVATKSGKMTAKLVWNQAAIAKRNNDFAKGQKFVDSEVLRYCDPLVPLQTGMLKKSGTLGTVIGSGLVQYIAPYARYQYYDTATTRPYDANRGAQWFERMKTAHKDDIENGLKKIVAGK